MGIESEGLFLRLFEAKQKAEERKPQPGPWLRSRASGIGQMFRNAAKKLTKGQADARHRAIAAQPRLRAKFEQMTRQRRRQACFAAAWKEVCEQYGPEPRRARRRMARGISKRKDL